MAKTFTEYGVTFVQCGWWAKPVTPEELAEIEREEEQERIKKEQAEIRKANRELEKANALGLTMEQYKEHKKEVAKRKI